MKKNERLLQQNGICIRTEELEKITRELEEAAIRQDAITAQLNECRQKAHALLVALKDSCREVKQPVKTKFPLERWQEFGILDKRF